MSGYGGMPGGAPYRWPKKEPDEDLDFTWDVEKIVRNRCAGAVDPLMSITLAVKPSGTGEMSYSRLSVDPTGFLITVWLSGGVPGRDYTVNIEAVSEAGRKYQWPIGVEVDRFFATWPPPPAPSVGYGPPLTWSLAPNEFGLIGADGDQLLGADGRELIWTDEIFPHGILGADGSQLLGADGADLLFA